MNETKNIRTKWLTIRLNVDEEKKLRQLYSGTTCNALSEYVRDVILKEPVNILYRNQTADEFLEEMILLRKELNAIGNNFNQVVHRLHTLDHLHEIRSWTTMNESSQKIFLKKVEEIQEKMNQIFRQWSQK